MAKHTKTSTVTEPTLTFFQAVEQVEVQVRQALDKSQHDRLSAAVALVKDGAVLEDSEGHWTVGSSTDPQKRYSVDRACSCEDALYQAPEGRCKHRLAKSLTQRVLQLLQAKSETQEQVDRTTGELTPAIVTARTEDGRRNDGWGMEQEQDGHETAPVSVLGPAENPQAFGSGPEAIRLGLRPISAIIADLSRPLPKECIGSLPKGGTTIAFLPWHTVAAALDAYAPGWDGEVARVDKIGERLSVTYRIRVPCAEGWAIREDSGMEDENEDEYGDAMTNATATAFKRAAAKFGVGRWLYDTKGYTEHFLARLRGDREKILAVIAEKAPEAGLVFDTLLAHLMTQTGAYDRALLPVWALRSTLAQVQGLIAEHKGREEAALLQQAG